MRWVALVFAIAIVALWVRSGQNRATMANAEAAVNQPIARVQQIRSISLDGHRLPLSRLREALDSRAGAQLDSALLVRDRDAMVRVLADLGYLAAHVEPAIVTFDAVGAAYITFEIDQGKLFHLRSVSVTGPGKDAVVVTLAPGDVAIRARIDGARQAMLDGLARRGKPMSVELSVTTDVAAAEIDVVLATAAP